MTFFLMIVLLQLTGNKQIKHYIAYEIKHERQKMRLTMYWC